MESDTNLYYTKMYYTFVSKITEHGKSVYFRKGYYWR
jgi:hypothetical protein